MGAVAASETEGQALGSGLTAGGDSSLVVSFSLLACSRYVNSAQDKEQNLVAFLTHRQIFY